MSGVSAGRRWWWWGMLLVLIGCSEPEDSGPDGRRAEAELAGLTLTRIDGDEVPLGTWRGRVLIVNIWATWCAPCREEMPALQALSEQLDPAHYAVVGISVDQDLNLVKEFLLKYAIGFDQFIDPGMVMAGERLKVRVLPETLVIDRQGRLHRRITGVRDWTDPDYLDSILPGGLKNG